ncbi:MAG: 1-deoxy-D-xylulose-5-phosphate reductoisomerase [Oscillospiraceae bacterium]
MKKVITVLGSTGSIGTQSLDVISQQGYDVFGLAAYSNVNLLIKQIEKYRPKVVAVVSENAYNILNSELDSKDYRPILLSGVAGLNELASMREADIVLNAVVGIAGLSATLAALKNGIDVALANKESLVTGGKLVLDAARENNAKILPVDSEHSAIFQCLQDKNSACSLEKILLTASGGPFFGKTKNELENITKKDALCHPNWAMGQKITIDSATLMNKGLELIEAVWLFNLPPEKVQIVVQRQSIIHSMVQFNDHSILAQLGVPDMRIPIQYALTYPYRMSSTAAELDFAALKCITFDEADDTTFRCLAACKKAINIGGLAPCAANGANEEAVRLFLEDKISFLSIGRLVEAAVENEKNKNEYTIDEVYSCDARARAFVMQHYK